MKRSFLWHLRLHLASLLAPEDVLVFDVDTANEVDRALTTAVVHNIADIYRRALVKG